MTRAIGTEVNLRKVNGGQKEEERKFGIAAGMPEGALGAAVPQIQQANRIGRDGVAFTRRGLIKGGAAIGAAAYAWPVLAEPSSTVEQWGIFEVAFRGPISEDAAGQAVLGVVFERPGRSVRVPGFYDGEGVYRVRFSPPATGRWTWRSASASAELDGQEGVFECTAPGAGNHGPVRISDDGFHFVYADGTPFRQIGTTAYSWALQSDAKCAETLAALARVPFNKIRMLVFPNVPSAATDPFVRTGSDLKDWDPTRLDPAYFRRFEERIGQLCRLGIQADVILFHPYDPARGYSDMRRADDERYIRYVAARWGAYRNLWWSMANEYDLIKSKTMADWDHLFETLVAADPHGRLRSIHQINTYYDHRKPWITHASVQNGAAVLDDLRAQLHRAMVLKPVIFDEVCYEGDIDKRWGNLTGQQLVERFWWGLLGGTYVGHGETYAPDRNADDSWLGKGGSLRGSSADRLAFLRKVMEDGPAPGIDPIQPYWNYHIAGKPFEYYLKYFGTEMPGQWRVVLPGRPGDPHGRYRAEIIDTWNMTVQELSGEFPMEQANQYDWHCPARPVISLPTAPYQAIRLRRI